jgi:uncharacterized membrane protein YfcA
MVFSSFYGTFRNIKNGSLNIKDNYPFGIGGIVGALIGGNFLSLFSSQTVSYIFLFLITFALIRVSFSKTKQSTQVKTINPIFSLIVGFCIGIVSGMLGVGGSILLIPILVGFFHYTTKSASQTGLFFVVFSSISAFVTLSYFGYIDYVNGAVVAVSSLFGVRAGQYLSKITTVKHHKLATIIMYLILFILTVNKIVIS